MGQGSRGSRGHTESWGHPAGRLALHCAPLVFRDSPLSPPREHRGTPRFGEKPFRGPSLRPPPCQWGLLVPPSLKAPEAERGFARGGRHPLRAQRTPTAGLQTGGRLRFSLRLLFNLPKAPGVESKGAQGDPLQVCGGVPRFPRGEQGPAAPEFTQSSARVRGTFNWIGAGGSPQFCPARVVRRGKPSVRLENPIARFCSSFSTNFFSIAVFPLSSSSSFHSASPSKALQMAFQTRKPFKEKWAHIPFQAPCQNLPSTLPGILA